MIKARIAILTEGRRPALSRKSPQAALWLVGWLVVWSRIFFLFTPAMKMEQGVLKRRHLKLIRREITKEKEYSLFLVNKPYETHTYVLWAKLFLNAKAAGIYSYHCVKKLAHIFTTM